jgi:hypothetical protein
MVKIVKALSSGAKAALAKGKAAPAKAKPTLAKGPSIAKGSGSAKKTPKAASAKAKPTLAKGQSLAKGSGSTKKTIKTGSSLTKGNLAKLGQVSLSDKVRAIAESAETEEEAAKDLKAALTKVEHSKVWGQHNTHLKLNPEAAAAQAAAGKNEKGLAAALWFVKKESKKFMNLEVSINSKNALTKVDQWQSEKQMLVKFTEDELQRHIASGRVLWRECPTTPEVWEYKDQHDISRLITVDKSKKVTEGQEWEPNSGQSELFSDLFDKDLDGLLADSALFSSTLTVKGAGKGGLSKGFSGKGLAKGVKGKDAAAAAAAAAALADQSEEEKLGLALSKARKMRDITASCISNFEEALAGVKKSKFWSKAARKDADNLLDELQTLAKGLKFILMKKGVGLEAVRNKILEAASKVKEASCQIKEFRHLAGQTGSVKSSK